jgi:hypothetical protein
MVFPPRLSDGGTRWSGCIVAGSGGVELSKKARAGWFVDEGGAEGFAVAGLEVLIGPGEVSTKFGILLL